MRIKTSSKSTSTGHVIVTVEAGGQKVASGRGLLDALQCLKLLLEIDSMPEPHTGAPGKSRETLAARERSGE